MLFAAAAAAQRTTASIRGTVTDLTGGLVPAATVTVSAANNGLTRRTTTDERGRYSFPELPTGTYQVLVERSGFKTTARPGIWIGAAADREVNVRLDPGPMTETVTVAGPAIHVQAAGGDVSGVIRGEHARELPVNGRSFLSLALLQPGVGNEAATLGDKGLAGGADLSVSGGATTANMWMVDGVDNTDRGTNRAVLIHPSIDMVEEVRIHRNSYGAEFGGAGGAQVNVVTRSGSNEFHGSLFYFGRHDALASRSYFLEQADREKQKLRRHDFGFSVGGPIVENRLHFFASQEWNREVRGTVRTAFVPTDAERRGDFSEPGIPGCSGPVPVDPLTGTSFPGDRIPAGRLSPAGLLYLQLFPPPNTAPGPGSCTNWIDSLDTPIDWRQDNLRLDWNIDERTRLMLRYTQDTWSNDAPALRRPLWGDDPFPAVDSNWKQPGRSLTAQLNHTIGANATNTLQFSYSGQDIQVTRGGDDPELNDRINAALPSLFPSEGRLYPETRTHPVFWGGSGYDVLWNEAPFTTEMDLWSVKDDYTAAFGEHLFKAGALFTFNEKDEDFAGGSYLEAPQFWGPSGLNGWGGTTGNLLSDMLLRDMAFGFSEFSAQRRLPIRWKDFELYAADSWRAHSNLTIDFGLRYTRFSRPYLADDTLTSFDPSLFDPALGADPCNGMLQPPGTTHCEDAGFSSGIEATSRSLVDAREDLFAPRLGVAWDVSGDGRTALRAGAGLFYVRDRASPVLSSGGNPPFASLLAGVRTFDSVEEPCEGCFTSSGGVPQNGLDPLGLTPNYFQWNLTAERELFRDTTLQASWVGNKGTHLLRTHAVNQVPSGDFDGNGVSDRLDYARSQGDASLRGPLGVYGDGSILAWDHTGSSIYHGLQVQLRSRFGRGSQLQASYTWSRTIATVPLNETGGATGDQLQSDNENPDLDRGLAETHRPHMFNASLVLHLPTFEDGPGFVRKVFGDWELGAIVVANAGEAVNVTAGIAPGINGISGDGHPEGDRPNRVPGEPCHSTRGPPEQILNPNAFTLAGFRLGTQGNAGRGPCTGAGFFQVDLALNKTIHLSERFKLQVRLEIFNLFNRVNFVSDTMATVLSPSGATYDAPRESATTITEFMRPLNFGQATETWPARYVQLGMKLIF